MSRRISAHELAGLVGTRACPVVVDVRRREAIEKSGARIAGALWRDHMKAAEWAAQFAGRPVVVHCVHGHNVSEVAAALLAAAGVDVRVLDGGFDAYVASGGLTVARTQPCVDVAAGASVWVTRERPKIDRIACPWLIRRFIDPLAVFHFVAAPWVGDVAAEMGATPFDVEGVHYSHRGETCSFDTLIAEAGLKDPAIDRLAAIVRGADTARPDLAPQAAGLLAISLGLSAIEADDARQLEQGMMVYDALYGWCRHATQETHNWPARAA